MINTKDTKWTYARSARLMAGLAVSAAVGIGVFASAANAQWNGHHRNYRHNWNGGYYRAPPVVYGSTYGHSYYGYSGSPYRGSPYYYPPPIIYGPGIGIPNVIVRIN